MSKSKIERRRQQVRHAIAYLQNYWETYSEQMHYSDYSDDTIIDDALYGLGVALWGEDEHRGPSGYERTIAKLREHLDRKP